MSDEALRRLERSARLGDSVAASRLPLERARRGEMLPAFPASDPWEWLRGFLATDEPWRSRMASRRLAFVDRLGPAILIAPWAWQFATLPWVDPVQEVTVQSFLARTYGHYLPSDGLPASEIADPE